jgi:phenylpropionate dioxygenase-like ring-hydroxylating dioxygenase large terminal subunit
MSDLSIAAKAIARSRTQLSVRSYFDEALYRAEQALIFEAAPNYVGHTLALPGQPPTATVQTWNGLVFEARGHRIVDDFAQLGPRAALDFSGFVLDKVEQHECDYNWKTFIEVYLEDYHVGPFHPGLGSFVTCDDLQWEFGRDYSVQTVGVHRALAQPGSAVYRRWHDALLDFRGGKPPEHGAIWLTRYPTVMVEWYPHVRVVSTLVPQGPQKTLNVIEFFYPQQIVAFERGFIEANQAAYMETCIEDDEIALRMDAGRRALYERGDDEAGPYQSPMEDGMQHFHEWYRRAMGAALDDVLAPSAHDERDAQESAGAASASVVVGGSNPVSSQTRRASA